MDINTTSIPLYEAAENPGCSVEKIRDLVLTDQASDSIGDKEILRISGNLISLAQASRITGKAKDELLDHVATDKQEAFTFFMDAEVSCGKFPIEPTSSNDTLPWPAGKHQPYATTLPLKAVRTLRFYSETIDAEGYDFPQRTPIKLEGYHIDLIRTGKPAIIEYGFLPDGQAFKVVNPAGGLLVGIDGLFIRKSDLGYDYGCPDEWLSRKYLTAKEGLLLLTGLNPKVIQGVDWSPSGDLYCHLTHVERLNCQNNPLSDYSLYSKQQLEDFKDIIDREASSIVKDAREAINKAGVTEAIEIALSQREDAPCVPPPPPSINDCRDNESYEACDLWLKRYDESEKLLDFFITRWLDIPRDLDESGIEFGFFLKWVYDAGIHAQVPWWAKAVEAGLLKKEEIRKQPTADQATPAQSLGNFKASPLAMEDVELKKLCRTFGYGQNSSTGVKKKLEEYNKRFPEHPIVFHRGKGGGLCLYQYEAWYVVSKVGVSSGRRKPRKSSTSKR